MLLAQANNADLERLVQKPCPTVEIPCDSVTLDTIPQPYQELVFPDDIPAFSVEVEPNESILSAQHFYEQLCSLWNQDFKLCEILKNNKQILIFYVEKLQTRLRKPALVNKLLRKLKTTIS